MRLFLLASLFVYAKALSITVTGCQNWVSNYGYGTDGVTNPIGGYTICDGTFVPTTRVCQNITLQNGYQFPVTQWYPTQSLSDVPPTYVNSVSGWVLYYAYDASDKAWTISTAANECKSLGCPITGVPCFVSPTPSYSTLSVSNTPDTALNAFGGFWTGDYFKVLTFVSSASSPGSSPPPTSAPAVRACPSIAHWLVFNSSSPPTDIGNGIQPGVANPNLWYQTSTTANHNTPGLNTSGGWWFDGGASVLYAPYNSVDPFGVGFTLIATFQIPFLQSGAIVSIGTASNNPTVLKPSSNPAGAYEKLRFHTTSVRFVAAAADAYRFSHVFRDPHGWCPCACRPTTNARPGA